MSSNPSARFLANSISLAIGFYTFEQAGRVALLMVWRIHCVFCTQVTEALPDNYPIRLSAPKNAALGSADALNAAERNPWENEPDLDDEIEVNGDISDSSEAVACTSELR